MGRASWSELAKGCVAAARRLMDRGFFDAPRGGGFAFSFENGDPDVFGYMLPIAWRNPQIMLFRGTDSFLPFTAAMLPNQDTIYALDASDLLATGFLPFGQVLPEYRPFLLAGGVQPDPEALTPFFFAEPPCSLRHGPNRDEARLLRMLLGALDVAHARGGLELMPMGQCRGEFSAIHLSGPPEDPQVAVQTAWFGTGMNLPDAPSDGHW